MFVVLVVLVKAERKCAAALENVAEFLKKRKERRGNVTILLPHLCFKVAP